MQKMLPPAISLMGPTASGKTDLAVNLVQNLPLEIISVDSALVYRDMNIGTAKPTADVLAHAPHHLIDLIDPTEVYSAGRFRTDALRLMAEITVRGNVPLLVGGTMLYFKALKDGLDELPKATPALRAELEARAAQAGWPALHAELASLDPETAARLNPNDSQRIQRALELCLSTGGTMSALLGQQGADSDRVALPYDLLEIGLVPADRVWLHDRINRRFEAMVRDGLVDELYDLRRHYELHAGLPSMRCVGYRQAWSYLEGDFDKAGLLAQGSAATRQLAKRQLTWLRGWQGAHEVDCMDAPQMEGVLEMVRTHLEAAA